MSIASHDREFYLDMRKTDLGMVKFYLELYLERGEERLLEQSKVWQGYADAWLEKANKLSTG